MNNDDLLARVAPILTKLPFKVVFLGGATTHLCITDPSAPEPQYTDDVDVVVKVTSPVEYRTTLREALRGLEAKEDTSEDASVCRWRLSGQYVDIMNPTDDALGFANRWHPLALETSRKVRLRDGTMIDVISPPVFVATKLNALLFLKMMQEQGTLRRRSCRGLSLPASAAQQHSTLSVCTSILTRSEHQNHTESSLDVVLQLRELL